MKRIGLVILLPICLFACGQGSMNDLCGKWKGVSLLEDGMPMNVPPGEIQFEFQKNGYYHYQGNLNYRESGSFTLKDNILYTLDTLNEASSEKAVQVISLDKESLSLRMNADGKERIVVFAKSR